MHLTITNRIICILGIIGILCAIICPMPAYATDEATASSVISKANSLKQQIADAQAAYLKAVADQGEAEAERDEAQTALDSTNASLTEARDRLSAIVKNSYSAESSRLSQILSGSHTLSDMLSLISDSTKVENDVSEQTQEVADLQVQQQQQLDDCNAKIQAATDAANEAQAQKEQFQNSLSGMAGEIQAVSSELSKEIAAEPTKASQMQSTLNYMNDVYNITETQARIISAAFQTSYAGANYCEAWVYHVYDNAGYTMPAYPDAYSDYLANVKSRSMTDIKAGALLYCSGSGSVYGHVGIALTDSLGSDGMDTLIIDNENSRTGVKTMREWLQWQAVCPNNGIKGFFGWGYPDSVNLG